MTPEAIGDPDIVYVQIEDDVYVEIYNVECGMGFEEFVNTTFYIKEIR